MKLADIEVGKTYYVRIPKETDEYLAMIDSGRRPRGWERERIYAEVLELDVDREVVERTTLNILGSPRVVTGTHYVRGGVRIRLVRSEGAREFIVPPRSIMWERRS